MLLCNYLVKRKIQQQKFAALIGVHHTTLSRWLDGKRTPLAAQARKIVEATKGKVNLEDIYG